MEPPATGYDAIGHTQSSVHDWRVSQLTRLGIPGLLAEVYADRIDWHQMPGWCATAARRGLPSASSADRPTTIRRLVSEPESQPYSAAGLLGHGDFAPQATVQVEVVAIGLPGPVSAT
jgi:hypothetical protein